MHSLRVLRILVLILAIDTVVPGPADSSDAVPLSSHPPPSEPVLTRGGDERTCNVVPKNQYIEMGSDHKIMCQRSCSLGRIYWTLNNIRIDDSLSENVNASHAILSLRNFIQHSATLQCHSFLTGQVLGGTKIKTYSKPSNISCILDYKNGLGYLPDRFSCSWEHRMNSSLKIYYTTYSLCDSCVQHKNESCTSVMTSCSFNRIPALSKKFTVIVRAKTAAWEVDSDPKDFEPFQILKITPPKIQVTALSNHLLVEWDRPHHFLSQVTGHCQVKYSKALIEETPEWVLNRPMKPKEARGNVSIEEVESCTNYTVSARCAIDKAPWSDWGQKTTVLSKLNQGAVKFDLWRKVAEPEDNGVRKVHAMWTEIPSTCPGEFRYTIQLTPSKEDTPVMDGMNPAAAFCGPSVCDVDVNQAAQYINLMVFHNGTLFAEESIYVPAIGESLPQVSHVETSNHEGDILVSWTAPGQPVRGYVIDWTHDGVKYFWEESRHTNTTLFDLQDYTAYNITVTPLFDDKTGLGTHALQSCSRVRVPETPFITNFVRTDKSLHVSWNIESQRQCSDVVVNYTVFYRAVGAEDGPQLNVTVSNMEVLLDNLDPGTKYQVYIMARALTGNTSSSGRDVVTRQYDPGFIRAFGVCGGFVIFLVLAIGLCFAVQWRKFKKEMLPNPGLSSLALWPSQSHQKIFQPFSNPSESKAICERVYPCELDTTTTCSASETTGFSDNPNLNPASDQTEERTDLALSPANRPAPGSHEERPVGPVETPPPGESTVLLAPESCPVNPYQSQSCAEPPAQSTSEQSKLLLATKPQSKTIPLTVYVTLDMFEQG